MIMFNYESLVRKMQSISKSKSEDVVYCSNITNNIKTLGIVLVIIYFSWLFIRNKMLFVFIYIVLLIGYFLYLALRRGSILLDEEKIFIVLFKPMGIREDKTYELSLKRIRFLDVKSNHLFNKVKISFISDEGRLVRMSLRYANVLYSPGSKGYKVISKRVTTKLKEIQKIIDKGDF